ncbi:discoidin domain-containing protein [Cupriavidus sp. KK10]|jgi:hypothetical protein|uniref:discoidin domain-containing protein n=1 Tax=Cupriavidus sp. KK10 TaxID=1478019 RepID=UPI001BAD8CD5|nr:discoidin domain-containing protein [Cupriavidus sp. KK10]QUN28696.1 discoidin domain-containing protein [Cupriavidus sp. KK10]
MAAHVYWRFVPQLNGGGSVYTVSSLILRSSAGGANLATGGTAIGSNYQGSFPIGNAFDGNDSTRAISSNLNSSPIGYQLSSAADIVEYAIYGRNDNSSFLNELWSAWNLEYSDDNVNWTLADSVRNQSWALSEQKTFTVGANTGNPSGLSVGKRIDVMFPAIEAAPPSASVQPLGKAPATSARTVSGTVTVGGVATGGLLVRAYAKLTGEYIGQATSAGDGTYSINCGNVWADVYVIAFDPTTYRAVTYDQIVPG